MEIYCTQNHGNCIACSLSSYGRDCRNNPIKTLDCEEAVVLIEDYSEQLCIEHLGHTPSVWYTGGSSHNDDRLRATVRLNEDEGESCISITDGTESQYYYGYMTEQAIMIFVRDWLENLWESNSEYDD